MIHMYWFNLNNNFGDLLSPLLCHKLSKQKVEFTSDFKKCDLVAIGSNLHMIKAKDFHGAIWGSGFIEPPPQTVSFQHARICATRGHLTRQILGCGEEVALGDPGLLADTIVTPRPKKYRLGVVPHFVDADNQTITAFAAQSPDITVIDVFGEVQDVIGQISACHAVISSSLHGLIVADSFGIPNGWIKLSDRVIGNNFKFKDYYSVFGIDDVQPILFDQTDTIESIAEKLQGYQRNDIDTIKHRLKKTFPFQRRKWFWQR